jgi:opacity protein-like surface antigen
MKKTPFLALSALVLLAASAAARADELIRFKSGYEMMAISHREEKDGMIIITLPDGGEVGFKKDLLELLEGDKESARTGPPPQYNMARRYNNKRAELMAKPEELPSRFLAKGSTAYNGQTVGNNYHDQKFERFSGGPIGEVGANGRIGIDVTARHRTKQNPLEMSTGQGQKTAAPTLQLAGPKEGE